MPVGNVMCTEMHTKLWSENLDGKDN